MTIENENKNALVYSLEKSSQEAVEKSGLSSTFSLIEAADFLNNCDRSQFDPNNIPDWMIKARLDMMTPPPPPEYLFKFGDTPVMPKGDLEIISGRPKRGKSMFLSLLLGVLIGNRAIAGISPLRTLKETGRLLYFDSEASEYTAFANFDRVFRTLGMERFPLEEIGIHVIRMRKMSREERRRKMAEAICIVRPSILVIDNIKDFLLKGLNDDNLEFIDFLKKVSEATYSIGVIHLNPGTGEDKERGNTGSELQQECGDTWRVDKNNAGYFSATHALVRNSQEAPDVNFCINNLNQLAGVGVADIPILTAKTKIKRIFGTDVMVSEKKLYDVLKAEMPKATSNTQKDKNSREIIMNWVGMELIAQNDENKTYTRKI